VAGLNPRKSYISIPIRPPAEKRVHPPDESTLNRAHQIFRDKSIDTELLIGYEGNAFAFTGNAEEDLLSITSVHPMREDAVHEFLNKAEANPDLAEAMVREGKLVKTEFKGRAYYLRKLKDY
jgi:wyosine [tRNA(Phe)-imidazoG37] synthetase (radical SAM superfamily)